jgi:uncharacterized protein YyaL (SSP411 family)
MGQTDDYAFLIRGLLDLYEASGKEEYALFAIDLQKRQNELFWDEEGGGYFASAPDEHVLIRMKDAQVRLCSGELGKLISGRGGTICIVSLGT